MPEPIVTARGVSKTYQMGREVAVRALVDVDLDVARGCLTAVMGPSGSGKSTLLNVLGCLDSPDGGELTLAGRRVGGRVVSSLAAFRLHTLGFVFQRFNLLDHLSALENVMLPLDYVRPRIPTAECHSRGEAALAEVGLSHRHHHRPDQLSGGEQQRVGIARATVNRPAIILADEPTGELDSATGARIVDLLHGLATERGCAVVVVTHDPRIAERAEQIIHLADGRVVEGLSLARGAG